VRREYRLTGLLQKCCIVGGVILEAFLFCVLFCGSFLLREVLGHVAPRIDGMVFVLRTLTQLLIWILPYVTFIRPTYANGWSCRFHFQDQWKFTAICFILWMNDHKCRSMSHFKGFFTVVAITCLSYSSVHAAPLPSHNKSAMPEFALSRCIHRTWFCRVISTVRYLATNVNENLFRWFYRVLTELGIHSFISMD
jgi:hypothetical protein